MKHEAVLNGKIYRIELIERGPGARTATIETTTKPGQPLQRKTIEFEAAWSGRDVLSLIVNGISYELVREHVPALAEGEGAIQIYLEGRRYAAVLRDPRALRSRRAAAGPGEGPRKLLSPMPGKVVRVLVEQGSRVEAGAGVLVIEAMKMQNELKAPKAGVVGKLVAAVGAAVNAGDVLAVIE